jgi:hypothetical protein
MWCYCSSYHAQAMVEVGDGSNGGRRFAWCVLHAGNRRSGSVGGVLRLTTPSRGRWPSRVVGGGAPPPLTAPGTAALRRGHGEGSMPPTDDRGGVQEPPAVWPRAVDRASSPCCPKIEDLGKGRDDDVAWWDPRVGKGNRGNCWSKMCFRIEIFLLHPQ